MTNFSKKILPIAASQETASKLAQIAERFSLSREQRNLQARILSKLLTAEIGPEDLARVLRINLNLNEQKANTLARAIQKEVLAGLDTGGGSKRRKKIRKNRQRPKKTRPEKKGKSEQAKFSAQELRAWFDRLVRDFNLNLSELQTSRLESAALTYLKDVRDEIETENVLYRSQNEGGVGLAVPEAVKITRRLIEDFPEEEKNGIRKSFHPRRSAREREKPPEKPFPPESLRATQPIERPKAIAPEGARLISDVIGAPPRLSQRPKQKKRGLSISDLSQIAQLKDLSIEAFKRKRAAQVVSEFQNKINALVGKDEAKRMQSIEAWRQCEPYQLYIMIGEESIGQGKTVAEVARERARQNKPYLTEEEFNAVADVSREFQY